MSIRAIKTRNAIPFFMQYLNNYCSGLYPMKISRFEVVRSELSFCEIARAMFTVNGTVHSGDKYSAIMLDYKICVNSFELGYIMRKMVDRAWHAFLIDQVNRMWGAEACALMTHGDI